MLRSSRQLNPRGSLPLFYHCKYEIIEWSFGQFDFVLKHKYVLLKLRKSKRLKSPHPSDSSWEYVRTTDRHNSEKMTGTRKLHCSNAYLECWYLALYTKCEVWSYLQKSYAFLKANNARLFRKAQVFGVQRGSHHRAVQGSRSAVHSFY